MRLGIKWPLWSIIGIYLLWGILLIAQKPGLQYDEALLAADAVHLTHSGDIFRLNQTPDGWACPLGRCIPLMSGFYVGAVKDYFVLPFFLVFGPHTPLSRLVSLLLGAVGIWGIYLFVAEMSGRSAAAVTAFVLAMNPALVDQTAFDNNSVGSVMAGFGFTAAALAFYARRNTFWRAFALGAALGFTVWTRANTVWILVAGGIAAGVVLQRRILIPIRHWLAVAVGGIVGGAPFLAFQMISGLATWKVQGSFRVDTPMGTLLRQRLFWLGDTLLSDGEHRAIWASPAWALPAWQLWFFPMLVLAACLVCLFSRRAFAQWAALTLLIATVYMCVARLQVAEHHMAMLIPLAAMAVVAACFFLQGRGRWARPLTAGIFVVYCASAIYWQVAAIRGLHETRGVGAWSNAELDLARYLDQKLRPSEVKIVDWGFLFNLYTLTNERIRFDEIYSPEAEDSDFSGRPWIEDIREGGVFLIHGSEDRLFPKPTAGFLRALTGAHPKMTTWSAPARDGFSYAEVIQIEPNSVGETPLPEGPVQESLSMGDPLSGPWLSGFYGPEEGSFRWTKREFSVRLGVDDANKEGEHLVMVFSIPEAVIRKTGALTLAARFGDHPLPPQTYAQPGVYTYRRDVMPEWIEPGANVVSFALDKFVPAGAIDQRELGIVVREISLKR